MAQIPIDVRARYWIAPDTLHLFLPHGNPVEFESQGSMRVRLRVLEEGERRDALPPNSLVCEVWARTTASKARKQLLDQIVNGKMPDGSGPVRGSFFPEAEEERYRRSVDEEGNLREGTLPALEHLPNTLQDFVADKSKWLYEIAEYALRALRWRAGASGGPGILEPHQYFEWSEDGQTWHAIWSGGTLRVSAYASARIEGEYRPFVEQSMADGDVEPLWHELYREADAVREGSPRSALITVVSAAEVAVKQCIAALVPEAATLIEDEKSPDIVSLINDYATNLQSGSARSDVRVMPPPAPVLERLEAAVSARNLVAHQGKKAPESKSLEGMFGAIGDLLWLLDCCRGQAWALRYVARETAELLPRLPET